MSNKENTKDSSKELIIIQILDSKNNPITNAKITLLAMGQKAGQKILLDTPTDSNGKTLFNSKPYLKDINRFEITINHPDYYSYPINRNRKICRSYEYGHLCVERFERIPSFYYNGKTLNISQSPNPTKKYALKNPLNQASSNQTQKEYYIQLQENQESLKIYKDENLTQESGYTLCLGTQNAQTESAQSQSNTTTILNFDSKEILERFTKDIQELITKDKKKGNTKLVHRFVLGEEKIQIFNKEGIYLFSIERKDRTETRLSTKELYDIGGIQWFESSAENYHKLVDVNPDLKDKEKCEKLGVLYFTWRDIVEFAHENNGDLHWYDILFMTSMSNKLNYARNMPYDWKQSPKGARGFILISMEGIPYWADAVGQIPFAIDVYRAFYRQYGNVQKARNGTIKLGYLFANGTPMNADNSNSYDNAMILRGINWAEKRYYKPTISDCFDEISIKNCGYKTLKVADYQISNLSKDSNGKDIF